MNTYHLKQKWNQGILGYPTAEEIDFLFAEVERLERELVEIRLTNSMKLVCGSCGHEHATDAPCVK